MNYKGPSRPPTSLLRTAAPLSVWQAAHKQALRSPMIRYQTGCVIFDPVSGEIVSKGCSHPDIRFSKIQTAVHAERHAVSNRVRCSIEGCWAVVYTLNGKGGCSWSSRPCCSCANILYCAEVERVIYCERTTASILGGWTAISEHPEALVDRAPAPEGLYAREQRIPSLGVAHL